VDAEDEPNIRVLHPPARERAIAGRATLQHGIITLDELRAFGLGTRAVQQRVRAGRLHVLHRGVYAVGHAGVGVEGRRLAAVRACGSAALLSHRSAADAWGLRGSNSARIDVLVPVRGRRSPAGIRLHTTRHLHPDDIAEIDGIPITSVARTLVDFAAVARPDEVERAVHQAEVLRLLDVKKVSQALDRAYGREGTHHLKAAIAQPSPGPTRSVLEERFLALCRRRHIRDPILNARVSIRHETIEVDALWPRHRVIVELDGAATHHTRNAFETDRRRDAALAEGGYTVIRLTHHRLTHEPGAVAAQLRRILDRHG
jgi:very-short-patch-repair endonuclease